MNMTKKEISKGLIEYLSKPDKYYNGIIVNCIKFEGFSKKGDNLTTKKLIVSLEYIDGISLDVLKSRIGEYLYSINMDYSGLLIEI